uniref:Uncharacterized protein n=1 Tax=Ditylum brightwellii TaxID=49249 RepID=A0A6S9FQI8_9STRA|mmetsp:Transcript_6895/g.10431  ORF Transcript_6895/g.10431 Transcript_6895/m.10431 type:complete len:158 (-) Transcript_6895:337-810(-)
MVSKSLIAALCLAAVPSTAGFSFVPPTSSSLATSSRPSVVASPTQRSSSTSLCMVDQNVIMGTAIGVGGFAFGIGLIAFTEAQGERTKERGGLSESMSTRIAGALLEDVEVDSVSDLGSLTSQLEAALKETGSKDLDNLEMTEEEKQKMIDDADDGW